MPTSDQIINDAAILTRARAWHLLEILRASDAYRQGMAVYVDLETTIFSFVGVADGDTDEAIKSRMLDANLTAFDDDIEDGTTGVKGGRYGADYSQSRDREDICKRILGLLYSGITDGATVYGFNSYGVTNKAVF